MIEEVLQYAKDTTPNGYVFYGYSNNFTYLHGRTAVMYEFNLHRRIWINVIGDIQANKVYAFREKDIPFIEAIREWSNTKRRKVQHVQLKEMYDVFSEVMWDVVRDNPDTIGIQIDILESLLKGDINSIRQYYKEGWSPSITPKFDEEVDEIRIYDGGKLLTVLVEDEIVC